MNPTTAIETFRGPGIDLYRVVLTVPGVGVFTYKPMKDRRYAEDIAAAMNGADSFTISMALCTGKWTKRGKVQS